MSMISSLDVGEDIMRIRQLPAAYIAEYVNTAKIEGTEEANALIPELLKLADQIENSKLEDSEK